MPPNQNSTDRLTGSEAHQYDWSEYTYPSTAIVESVADAVGRDQSTLARLHDYVDCDALDALVTGESTDDLELSFVYDDVHVTVVGDGRLLVDTDW